LPFRSIPQDISYAFYRGINASNIFWQNPASAYQSGLFLEVNSNTCTDVAVKLNPANGNTIATTDPQSWGYWGFKESVGFSSTFYIYSRSSARKTCQNAWLSADIATCTNLGVTLTNWFGDANLW
jgi:hypothetical protein